MKLKNGKKDHLSSWGNQWVNLNSIDKIWEQINIDNRVKVSK